MNNPTEMKAQPDAQMQAVLTQLGALGAKPLETLTPAQARAQATPADAVKAVLKMNGKSVAPMEVAKVENRTIPGPGGEIAIRIYWPQGADSKDLPVVLYIHGGGWVIADLDVYDSSPRALANATGAIVISTHYRQAPEHKFPAAHDDTWAAWLWTLTNAKSLGGDAHRIAVVGESAGGNMAAAIAIRARDEGIQAPLHQVLIYPVTDASVGTTQSERENVNSKPLGTPALTWFYEKYLANAADKTNPRFAVLNADLHGVAPATIVLAQIDPLRSEGEAYAERLRAAGVAVDGKQYDGVTHEFFGMGAVIDKAKDAVAFAAAGLKRSLSSR